MGKQYDDQYRNGKIMLSAINGKAAILVDRRCFCFGARVVLQLSGRADGRPVLGDRKGTGGKDCA